MWHPTGWTAKPAAQDIPYDDPKALDDVLTRLRQLPPLVTSYEIEALETEIAEAQEGKRFVIQGGDCAELVDECRPDYITSKLKILLQMSLVLVHGAKKPVIRIGRFAGQYAKPRSKPTETRGDETLPSYFGDLVNRIPFEPDARRPDPRRLLDGYHHAAMTLNFIRSLADGGFADLHHPEHWDLSFMEQASMSPELRAEYQATSQQLASALEFMEALGETSVEELSRVNFYTSHEGLNLHYESAQTRSVPRKEGYWDLTTHLPWIGERTRQLDGAHVEFFRGIRNPVGVKVGPTAEPDEVIRLLDVLNPDNRAGKIVLISRLGVNAAADVFPKLLRRVTEEGRRVLWISDPMHGNTRMAPSGVKTRYFDDIAAELETVMEVHRAEGTVFGGVHFELTGEDVTECVGGAAGPAEGGLRDGYSTGCDPRLNYGQALELAFRITRSL